MCSMYKDELFLGLAEVLVVGYLSATYFSSRDSGRVTPYTLLLEMQPLFLILLVAGIFFRYGIDGPNRLEKGFFVCTY